MRSLHKLILIVAFFGLTPLMAETEPTEVAAVEVIEEGEALTEGSVEIAERVIGAEKLNKIKPIVEALQIQLMGISLFDFMMALAIIIATLIIRGLIVQSFFGAIKRSFEKRERKSYNVVIEALEKPAMLFLLFLGIFLATQVLPLKESTDAFLTKAYQGISMIVLFWGLLRLTDASLDLIGGRMKQKSSAMAGFFPLIKRSVNILVMVVGGLMVIDNLGYDVAGIIATLGIGGAAVALASKDTVANFFGSLCIILDRPFKVGDWIEVDGKLNGDVVSIGLRSTRIKTFMATSLSIPNSVLANETINNWSRMPKRRVKQVIGVSYETDPDTMHKIAEDIRELLRNHEDVQKDFILVNFTDFGESSLDILVYYFTITTNWLEFLDVRQDINVKMMKIIRNNQSSIAFPSRTLYFGGDSKLMLEGAPSGDGMPSM